MRTILATILLAISTASAAGQLRPGAGIHLRKGQIARALSEHMASQGIAITSQDVDLLTDVTASVIEPALIVYSVEPSRTPQGAVGNAVRATARMGCKNARECLPFYVFVRLRDVSASAPRAWSAAVIRPHPSAEPPLLHAGMHAMLTLQHAGTNIYLPVVALANAMAGDTVRVAALSNRHVYSARVVDASTLQGEF